MGFTTDEMAEFYEFLDDLRESGETNMFGACPYLENEFGFDGRTARGLLKMWMATFDKDKTPQERALA